MINLKKSRCSRALFIQGLLFEKATFPGFFPGVQCRETLGFGRLWSTPLQLFTAIWMLVLPRAGRRKTVEGILGLSSADRLAVLIHKSAH